MADSDQISVEVTDKVSSSISTKLQKIASDARAAHTSIVALQSALDAISVNSLTQLSRASQNATNSLRQTVNATNQLSTAQANATRANANAAAAQTRAATATIQNATASQRLTNAQTAGATAAQRLAAATAQTQAAQNRAAQSALSLQSAQDKASKAMQGTSSALSPLTKLIAAYLTYETAKKTIEMADAFTSLQNKLQTVTSSQAQVNELTERLFELANRTRTSVDATATAFTRFDRSLALMGKSQEDTLRMTETINKALVISGATAQETSSALLQLSQAFNSGKLQGDEFRSLSENMPIVLDAVAKALGVSTSQVKKLSSEGKITSEVLFKAFQLIQQQVDSTFGRTIPTVGQAFEVLSNNAKNFIGQADQATGATRALASIILSAADVLGAFANEFKSTESPLSVLLGQLSDLVSLTAQFVATGIGDTTNAILGFDQSLRGVNSTFTITEGLLKGGIVVFQTLAVIGSDISFIFGRLVSDISGLGHALVALATGDFKRVIEIGGEMSVSNEKAKRELEDYQKAVMAIGNSSPDQSADGSGSRRPQQTSSSSTLRGAGKNTLVNIDEKAQKAAEKRALTLTKINTELDNEINRIGMLNPELEKQQKFDEISQSLITKKIKLTSEEAAAIKEKIAQIKDNAIYQQQLNALYNEVTGPAKEYGAALKAIQELNSRGYTSQEQMAAQTERAAQAYQAATDPMYAFNKQAKEQFEILKKVGPEMQVQQAIIQARNSAIQNGLPFGEKEIEQIRRTSEELRQQQMINTEINSLRDETVGKMETLTAKQTALNYAMNNGWISAQKYNESLVQLGIQAANLNLQMGRGDFTDALTAGFGKYISNYQGVLSGLSNAWGEFFTSFADGFADSVGKAIVYSNDLNEALSNVAREAVAGLISALIKLGIQYAVNAALGQSLGAASAAASVGIAAATGSGIAAAYAPAAAFASLASFGANAAPAAAGITSTVALSESLALGSMLGFENGGWTGNGGRSDIAGVVHGQEYVMDADSTKAIGVDNLDAMRRNAKSGSSPVKAGGGVGGTQVYVNVQNNASANVTTSSSTDEDGNVTLEMMINPIETALASRIESGSGKLHRSMQRSFNLTPNTRL